MRRLKTVRRPPIYPNEPSHLPCSSLTHPAAVLTPSIGVLRWIRGKKRSGMMWSFSVCVWRPHGQFNRSLVDRSVRQSARPENRARQASRVHGCYCHSHLRCHLRVRLVGGCGDVRQGQEGLAQPPARTPQRYSVSRHLRSDLCKVRPGSVRGLFHRVGASSQRGDARPGRSHRR